MYSVVLHQPTIWFAYCSSWKFHPLLPSMPQFLVWGQTDTKNEFSDLGTYCFSCILHCSKISSLLSDFGNLLFDILRCSKFHLPSLLRCHDVRFVVKLMPKMNSAALKTCYLICMFGLSKMSSFSWARIFSLGQTDT